MKHIFSLFVIMSFARGAHAGLMLEPFLGYYTGTTKITRVAPATDLGYKETGTGLGARVGYKSMEGFWVAGEYAMSSGKSKPDVSTLTTRDYKQTSYGITAGFDLIFGLRLFAGYNLSNKITLTTTGSSDTVYKEGTSTKLGVGYKFPLIPLALNLEYFMNSPNKAEFQGVTYSLDQIGYSSIKSTGILLSVSAPFNI